MNSPTVNIDITSARRKWAEGARVKMDATTQADVDSIAGLLREGKREQAQERYAALNALRNWKRWVASAVADVARALADL